MRFPFRLLSLAAAAVVLASATGAPQAQPSRPNAVSVELGGAGGAYSVGYERAITPVVRARVGVAYYGFSTIVPVTVLFTPEVGAVGGRAVRAEVGLGAVVGSSDSPSLYSGGSAFEDGVRETQVLPTGLLGARVEFGRVDLRAGASALYGMRNVAVGAEDEVFVFPQLGASYRF